MHSGDFAGNSSSVCWELKRWAEDERGVKELGGLIFSFMLNLFPIPILDGGHLVIFAYEAVVGRQPHEKFLNFAMSVGFVLLMALMVFATYNDVMKI